MSENKVVDTATPVVEDPTVGRIQVSAQRKRRFYVYVARRQFATKPEQKQVQITALGSAVSAAIATAGELEEMKVGKIVEVKTSYSPVTAQNVRSVARIVIVVERDPEWKPDETDTQRPPRPVKKEEGTTQESAPVAEAAPVATKEVVATA